MQRNSLRRAVGIALVAALSVSLSAFAQQYSAGGEVTVLQGFKPGGGSDALAQLVQPYLAKELGATFVNQYMPGATGAIAWTKLAKQTTADGRTISITNTPMLMTNYLMNPAIKYSIDELTPLANVVTDPGVIVVGKESPFKTAKELFAAARANPGKITVGNSGVGGDDYLSTIMIERASGMKFQKIPFEGDGRRGRLRWPARSTPASTTSASRIRRSRPATCVRWLYSRSSACRNFPMCRRCANWASTSLPARRAVTARPRGCLNRRRSSLSPRWRAW